MTNMAAASAGGNPARIQPGDAAVRGQHANLPLDAESIANDRGQVVEHLAQVAARFALRQDRGDEEPRVDERNACAQTPSSRPAAACRNSAGRRAA